MGRRKADRAGRLMRTFPTPQRYHCGLPTPLPTPFRAYQHPSTNAYANTPANASNTPANGVCSNPPHPPGVGSALARAFHPASDVCCAGAPLASKTSRETSRKQGRIRLGRKTSHRALSRFADQMQISNMNQIINAPSRKKDRPLPRKISLAVEMLVSGEKRTITAAAQAVGLTREHLSKALRSPRAQVFLEQKTRETLSASRAPAAATLLRLLDQAKSEHVQKDIATTLLAMNGHQPVERTSPLVSINITPGYIVKLKHFEAERPAAPIIDVTPERDR
jgi:hypothetical protein